VHYNQLLIVGLLNRWAVSVTKILAVYLLTEMNKEGIEPVYYDEDEILTPDVRDMMQMEVRW